MISFKKFLAEAMQEEQNEEKKIKTEKEQFSLESSIDYPASHGLCPEVWEIDSTGKYVLKQDVKQKLQSIVDSMPEFMRENVHIIGSICSNLFKNDTDIDLHFVVDDKNVDIEKINDINKVIRTQPELLLKVSKDMLKIGSHPVELYIQMNKYQDMASVGCYDFNNDSWLAGPEVMPLDYDPLEEFASILPLVKKWGKMTTNALSNLRMSIADYIAMCQAPKLPKKEKLLKQKAKIVDQMKVVSDLRDQLVEVRKNASQPSNEENAKNMRQSKEWKNANALFKFLQRYKFIDICNMIKQEYDQYLEDESFSTHLGTIKSMLHI